MAKIPLMLDVDTGVDDALALALAVASPEIDLIGGEHAGRQCRGGTHDRKHPARA